jgi:hypothetical protein
MKGLVFALLWVGACKTEPVHLRGMLDTQWESAVCGAFGRGNETGKDDDSAPLALRVTTSFDCNVSALGGVVTTMPVFLRGDRDYTATWCSARFGPVYVRAPVAPDTAVSIVEDPLLAALFRTAFVGVDPHRDYDLETDRAGVRLSAHQHRSNDGVELTLGVDGCKPSDVPEMRQVGAPLSFARR